MFFHIQYRIKECEDDVFQSDSSDSENEEQAQIEEVVDQEMAEVPKFPKGFIFSCIGVGLTNFARKAE